MYVCLCKEKKLSWWNGNFLSECNFFTTFFPLKYVFYTLHETDLHTHTHANIQTHNSTGMEWMRGEEDGIEGEGEKGDWEDWKGQSGSPCCYNSRVVCVRRRKQRKSTHTHTHSTLSGILVAAAPALVSARAKSRGHGVLQKRSSDLFWERHGCQLSLAVPGDDSSNWPRWQQRLLEGRHTSGHV